MNPFTTFFGCAKDVIVMLCGRTWAAQILVASIQPDADLSNAG